MKNMKYENNNSNFEKEFYEKRFDDANRYFKFTLTVISSVIILVTLLIGLLSVIASNRVDNTVERMEKRFNELTIKSPSLELYYKNEPLNNQEITLNSKDSIYFMPKIEFYNNGNGASTFPSITLAISDSIQLLTRNIWLSENFINDDDNEYNYFYELYTSHTYTPDLRVIFPGERDYFPEFKFSVPQHLTELDCELIIHQENEPTYSRFNLIFDRINK